MCETTMNIEKIKIQGLVDKRNIRMLLGCYCNNIELALRYETVPEDYPEEFHRQIFKAIMNIAVKGHSGKITPIDIENELSLFKTALDIWNYNNGVSYIQGAIDDTENLVCNVELYWDNVRKYSILRNAIVNLKLDMRFVYEEYDELNTFDPNLEDKKIKMEKFNNMTSDELLKQVYNKFTTFCDKYKSKFSGNYSFKIGDGVDDLLDRYKNKDGTYGLGYQNLLFNTAFRGKKRKKYMLVSRGTGAGKSRMMIGSALDVACGKLYDWSINEWVSTTNDIQPMLYITSELEDDEVTSIALAHISGIDEDRIVDYDDLTDKEIEILEESKLILKESLLYCEYVEEYNINWLEDTIRSYVIGKNIYGVAFDYIAENIGLYAESFNKTGFKLEGHKLLLNLSNAIKLICNKYKLYFETATQINDNWKQEGNLDSSSIRGAKAIADKCDNGLLGMKMAAKDYKKIDPILKSGIYKRPNYFYSCYKNRGGKLVNFLCFTLTDLGTAREEALFITDMNYELIDIEKTDLGFNVPVLVDRINYNDNNSDDSSALDMAKSYVDSIKNKNNQ